MVRTRYTRIRALVGVVALTLALVAGIVGTTEPAAALDMDPNTAEWLCDAFGGDLSYQFDVEPSGAVTVSTMCYFSSSDTYLWCVDGPRGSGCIFL